VWSAPDIPKELGVWCEEMAKLHLMQDAFTVVLCIDGVVVEELYSLYYSNN